MRRTRQDLGFVALKIEGGILPAEFLQKVVALEAKGQSGKDYKLPKGTTIKDEIGRAWRIASAEWREYRENCERQDVDRTRIGIDQWLVTLLKVAFSHEDIAPCSVIHMGDRAFPITHKSVDGVVPLVLATENFRLDKTDARFGEEGRRRSPHALMQEFLNANDDCLWGIISNGRVLQLLRDNPSLTKPAYIEADLERIFEEQLYSDFAAMWLIFHASRFRCGDGKPSDCMMEEWRNEGHETGERALADLRKGVTTALKELGNGFLQMSQNMALKEALKSGELSPDGYYRELLRMVYRLLFLLCVEDRELLHGYNTVEQARLLYRKGYSASRLRECALLKRNYDRHRDLWEGLQIVFKGLGKGEKNLALPALGGLFVGSHCPYIDQSLIENQFLLRAVFALSFFRTGDVLARVNYRDMGTEELGSVYESLLELHPNIDVDKSPWTFEFVGEGESAGSERRLSGSYYTPASLVNELVKSAVDPVIEQTKKKNLNDPRRALLGLKVIDPACGSGHFLLAAARRLAIEIAKLDQGSESSEEATRRHALREVLRSCIYGVDKNELALELCKTALWIETVEPGSPLNFLDAHLRCGDSLVGILNPSEMEKGIPDEAYTALTRDDKATVSELKRKNKDDKYEYAVVQGSVFDQKSMTILRETREAVDKMPEETIEEIEAKQEAFEKWLGALGQSREEIEANLFVGAFFAEKTKENLSLVPRTEDLNRIKRGMAARSGLIESCQALAQKHNFFHWHLAFSEVFKKGGFDVVLGNPPWERIKLEEREYFESRKPDIAVAKNKAERERLIKSLFLPGASQHDKRVGERFTEALRGSEAASSFIRGSGRYPLCGRGDINTYAVFAETMRTITGPNGRVGCILPSGIATDDTTKFFFQDLMNKRLLVSLFDFENKKGIFPAVAPVVKFCLLTMCGSSGADGSQTDFVFFALDQHDLENPEKHFSLSAEDLRLLNPNTGTCPTFRSRKDAELTRSIHSRIPVLVVEGQPSVNHWGIRFTTMFHMSNDSSLFKTYEQLIEQGFQLDGNKLLAGPHQKDRMTYLPLYEAKLFHQFNHRFNSFEGVPQDKRFLVKAGTNRMSVQDLQDPKRLPLPRYWVAESNVKERVGERKWLALYRDTTNVMSNRRNGVFTIVPAVGASNKCPCFCSDNATAEEFCVLLACLNSFVFDYCIRQKLAGGTLNFFILKQVPVPCLTTVRSFDSTFGGNCVKWIANRVLELVYTSWDLKPFAEECGNSRAPFDWDEERRDELRADLDAACFYIYGCSLSDADYILDTFTIARTQDEEKFGSFRSKDLILRRLAEFEMPTATTTSVID